MPTNRIHIVLLLLAIFGCPLIAAAQEERPQKPTGNSIISGRVLYVDTGRPVRRASVMLYSDLNRSPARTTPANVRGEFRFNEVVAGAYFVVAVAPGIVSPFSAFSITELGINGNHYVEYTRVTVDGKNASRCEVKAIRGGTIKGTITYDDKEPVVNARVLVYRRGGDTVAPYFLTRVVTNDRGMYRLDGLPEGEYFVGLANGETVASPAANRQDLPCLTNAFYPGVRSLAEAKAISVHSGSEVSDISFTLNDDELREVSGIVKWRGSNDPIADGGLSLRRKDDAKAEVSFADFGRLASDMANDDGSLFGMLPYLLMSMPATEEVNEKGEWTFKDVPPGTYIATAFAQLPQLRGSDEKKERDPSQPPPIDQEPRFVSRQIELTVDHEDLKNVTIELSDGGRILGVVVGEDSTPLSSVMVSVNQKGVDSFMLDVPRASEHDGTFMIDGVPAGEVLIDAVAPRGSGFYLKSIALGSQDLMREPLRMEEGAEVTGIRITLDSGMATVIGRAQSSDGGSPVGGAEVLLVPADPALWHLQSLHVFKTADANGAFRLECPPGDYLVFTWDSRNRPVQKIENFVRSHAANARRITLQSKEEKQIEVTIK